MLTHLCCSRSPFLSVSSLAAVHFKWSLFSVPVLSIKCQKAQDAVSPPTSSLRLRDIQFTNGPSLETFPKVN